MSCPSHLPRGGATPRSVLSVSPNKMNQGCAPTHPHNRKVSPGTCRLAGTSRGNFSVGCDTLARTSGTRSRKRTGGPPPPCPPRPSGGEGSFLCGACQVFRRVGVANRIEARGAPPTRGRPLSQDPEVRMTLRGGGGAFNLIHLFCDTRRRLVDSLGTLHREGDLRGELRG